MSTLYVREIPETLYKQVREIATLQGRSISSYVVTVLEQAVEEEKLRHTSTEILEKVRRRRSVLPIGQPDSVAMIQQIRGEGA